MDWLLALDTHLFRFINQSLSNPLFDWLMPWLSGKAFFFGLAGLLAVTLIWRWRGRGIVCLFLVLVTIVFGDGVVGKNLKRAVARERPWATMTETKLRVGKGDANASMPSSHTVNWFAAMMVLFIFNRRTLRVMLPVAVAVGFSRIYNGVHYPSDVLVGAILGAGQAAALVIALEWLWRWAGKKWFPLWWEKFPSLILDTAPKRQSASNSKLGTQNSELTNHWLRAGCVFVALLTLFRWGYIASGVIELSEDEAYQWVWSKHLELSYYSKPPLIAYTQFLGTTIFGDTALGVRFFSPLLAGIMGIWLMRFIVRESDGRTGFFLVLILSAAPLLALGATLMTVDPLSVFFWTAAMLAGWRAVQDGSQMKDWLWVGLWMGLGFLSKYTALFQWLCWAVFFVLWSPARKHLRRAGPYLALLVNAVCAVPVLIWNAQRGWPTVSHVIMDNAKLGKPWALTFKSLLEFIGGEFGLLNPVFFVGVVLAAIAFFRRSRNDARLAYFFSMGAPLFLAYLVWTIRARVQLNWIAPAILPLFCLMVLYWHQRWKEGFRPIKTWLTVGLILGFVGVGFMHETDFIRKLVGQPLPVKSDPMRRVRGWKDAAKAVAQARVKLLAEGKPVFVIGDHYGITGLMSFYLPEARKHVKDAPLVYCLSSDRPRNQFYFWDGYFSLRKGQNAIFVTETKLSDGPGKQFPEPAPARLLSEFESVTDLGVTEIKYRNRVFHSIQLFECRNLR